MALWLEPAIAQHVWFVGLWWDVLRNKKNPCSRQKSRCFINHGLKMDFKQYSSLYHLQLGVLAQMTFLALNGLVKFHVNKDDISCYCRLCFVKLGPWVHIFEDMRFKLCPECFYLEFFAIISCSVFEVVWMDAESVTCVKLRRCHVSTALWVSVSKRLLHALCLLKHTSSVKGSSMKCNFKAIYTSVFLGLPW